jgi:hypothetical protein
MFHGHTKALFEFHSQPREGESQSQSQRGRVRSTERSMFVVRYGGSDAYSLFGSLF